MTLRNYFLILSVTGSHNADGTDKEKIIMIRAKLEILVSASATSENKNIFWNNVVNFKAVRNLSDRPAHARGPVILVDFEVDDTAQIGRRFDQVRNFAHMLGILGD